MSRSQTWMLYGAVGYTGSLIAQCAHERGHRPLLAARNRSAVTALAERLDMPHRVLALDDPAALRSALAEVDVVLNAAGPFLHTAAPLAAACLDAGVHYIDIGNELQVFRTLYDLDQRARQAGVAVIPGAGFGVVATNCLARYVSDAVGGAQSLEVAARAATAQPGPGIAASVRENLPYGVGSAGRGACTLGRSAPGLRRSPSPTGLATSCRSPQAIWKRPSRRPVRPTSPRTRPYQPDRRRVPNLMPAGRSGGHKPPARTAPSRRRCFKPASPTPSPPPPASAP